MTIYIGNRRERRTDDICKKNRKYCCVYGKSINHERSPLDVEALSFLFQFSFIFQRFSYHTEIYASGADTPVNKPYEHRSAGLCSQGAHMQ